MSPAETAIPPHRALGLTDAEYELIVAKLGREPNAVELSMFSLMWSEHCAYKHSKKLLGQLPTEGPYLLLGPGENAGAVDVGDGLAIAFKVESHNHPSAVEPFQGAATGVGGILRDIFAVGARPIAVLDSLRFGELDSARSRYLLEHAVAGIGHYGNSIGVPTIGGELYFEGPYEQNCLVNAMALGIADRDRLIRSAATGPGNVLILFGALTGRDGIGGASVLASAELGEADADKRPTVQIGDPFAEKKLMECSLELLDRELLVSLQDLGAAGLTSSSSEMASKGGLGLDIHVDRVPLREPGMEPFEIMVSESQERMLCVVEPARVDEVLAVCAKWETTATAIGEVTDSGRLRVLSGGDVVGDMPVPALVDDCPLYDLEPAKPSEPIYPAPRRTLESDDPAAILPALLRSANIADRRPVFEQYDCLVQSRTVRRPDDADAAVLMLPDGSAIAVSIDGSGRRVACDPYRGTIEAVLECAANLACVGAEPLGLTNCLNFGNPEKPHIAWQLTESVRGMADALPRVGRARRRRQCLLVQRGTRGTDLPDARRRDGREAAGGRARRPARLRRRGRRDRLRRSLPALPAGVGAGEAARRAAARRAARGRPRGAAALARGRPRGGPPRRAALGPRRRRGRPRGRARGVLPRRRPRRPGRLPRCGGRAAAGGPLRRGRRRLRAVRPAPGARRDRARDPAHVRRRRRR